MIRVLSNCPDSELLMRKYVDNSIGQRTRLGMKQNEPSENTALLRAAKKLSLVGTTEPRYFLISSGYSRIASVNEQKITPCFLSFSLYVVATETESNTASTATPASCFCSVKGMPSFSKVRNNSGSTSSRLALTAFCLGAL